MSHSTNKKYPYLDAVSNWFEFGIYKINPLKCPECGGRVCSVVPYYCADECANEYCTNDGGIRYQIRNGDAYEPLCECDIESLERNLIDHFFPNGIPLEVMKEYNHYTLKMQNDNLYPLDNDFLLTKLMCLYITAKNIAKKSKEIILPDELFNL